jgi:hypothetical protein
VPLVETASDQAMLLNVLIRAVCRRAGTL